MALYPRLLGIEGPLPKIPVHAFQATVCEWGRGKLNASQANAVIAASSGVGLDAGEIADATALVNTIPAGGTTANQAARANRLLEINHVLLLADGRLPGYSTEAELRAKLGL